MKLKEAVDDFISEYRGGKFDKENIAELKYKIIRQMWANLSYKAMYDITGFAHRMIIKDIDRLKASLYDYKNKEDQSCDFEENKLNELRTFLRLIDAFGGFYIEDLETLRDSPEIDTDKEFIG